MEKRLLASESLAHVHQGWEVHHQECARQAQGQGPWRQGGVSRAVGGARQHGVMAAVRGHPGRQQAFDARVQQARESEERDGSGRVR